MKIQLRKFDGGCTICAYDSIGQCHVNKTIDNDEFDTLLAFYMDTEYEVNIKNDKGQSEELYEIELT